MIDIQKFEEKIGYSFNNKSLLINALTHTSYAFENHTISNERLEYLGDSILEFISSKYLYLNYPDLTEGEMTKVRASAVCEDSLYKIAIKNNFSDFLFLGKSEKSSENKKNAILADSVEAVIAAIYLDSDIEKAEKFIIENIKEEIEFASKNVGLKDYKTHLQEKLQENGEVHIEYRIIKEEGPDHDKMFTVEVLCDNKKIGEGQGKSKKQAEMDAAKNAIQIIE